MAKNPYANRLIKLFSTIQPETPEPADPALLQESELLAGCSEAPERSWFSASSTPETSPTPSPVPSMAVVSLVDAASEASAYVSPLVVSPAVSGWDDFLDGIHRDENIGYSYDGSDLKLEGPQSALPQGGAGLGAPILVAGQTIGKLLLGADDDRRWDDEDLDVLNAVAQQLAQQIETLRLLDESERSRAEAQESFRRLAHQSGAPSQDEHQPTSLPALRGWAADGTSLGLQAVDGAQRSDLPDQAAVLQTPIRLDGTVLGQLEISKAGQSLDQEEINLVETISQHLAQQMENLRLLEESRHFRGESEEAIRRLTYQSWQAYLAGTAPKNLAFQYDRNHVSPLSSHNGSNAPAFALKVREEVIGQLAIESPVVAQEEVKALVNVISDRLSTHLDGLRLADQREQALAESELLYTISARLSTAQSLEEALTSVSLPALAGGAHDSRLFIANLDEKGVPESLSLTAVWYPEEGAQLAPVVAQLVLADYPSYRMALSNPDAVTVIENVNEDPRLDESSKQIFLRSGAQGAAILPLAIAGRWVGVVFINWSQPHLFSEQERRLYTTLSRQAAVVVNNRLLLEQTRRRAQELQTVAQVSTAASTVLDPYELLQSVVDLTKSSFSLYHTQAFLHRPFDRILEAVAGSGEIGRQIVATKHFVIWDDAGPVARSARERQVVIINDAQAEAGYSLNALLPNLHAEMVIPMIVGDRLLGVFDVQSDQANRFTREDARTFTTLASQVAVALQNAELYAEQSATVERLRELDHLKSAFLANMSHELRTPLNSILGFAEVLLLELDGPLNEIMNNDVKLIEKNGKHLLSLINDVLDMAKIEAGRMNLSSERFVLRELLEETIDITSSLAREKKLYLHIHPDSEDRIEMVADRVRIRQVLINVISNAVKFTEQGGITIHTYVVEGNLRLEVQDTGIGIPEDKLELIFEAFSQVDNSTTRKVGGTGLGLPISRRLVEMHSGRLWAESHGISGEGSCFIIEIPREPVNPA